MIFFHILDMPGRGWGNNKSLRYELLCFRQKQTQTEWRTLCYFFSNLTLISQTPPAPLALYSHWQGGGPAHLRKQALCLIVTYGQRWWLQYLHMDIKCACVRNHFSRVRLFTHQAPLPMGFSRQEYWPFPPPVDLPNSGIEPPSLCLLNWQAGSWPLTPPGKS